jgi:hypothetical protein
VCCEKCRRPEVHVLFWKRRGNLYWPCKNCPQCGMERI